MRLKFLYFVALLAACAVGASAAVIHLTTEDLTRNATLVISGTVEDVKSYPPDGAGIIYSEALVRVRDTVKGASAAPYVTVRYTGGEYEGRKNADGGSETVRPATQSSFPAPRTLR